MVVANMCSCVRATCWDLAGRTGALCTSAIRPGCCTDPRSCLPPPARLAAWRQLGDSV